MDALTTVSVTLTTYPTNPQVTQTWEPDSIMFVVASTTAADLIYVSFNGTSDAGVLRPGVTGAVAWQSKRTNIWLRLGPAAINPTSVDVMTSTVR
jgi:hypothetical protein